jgi:hypothetical protein
MEKSNISCELIEKCPFFNTLRMESTAETLKILFCKERWENCERWKLRTSGQEVPGDLWPNGIRSPFSS